jgi:hypothetical protein
MSNWELLILLFSYLIAAIWQIAGSLIYGIFPEMIKVSVDIHNAQCLLEAV